MIEWHADHVWHHVTDYRRMGVNIGQRMTVVRLADKSLLVHNPCDLNKPLMLSLEKLGKVSCVTTVNQYLHNTLSDWWLAYPEAYFYAAPGLDAKRTDIGFDGLLNSATSSRWEGQLFHTVIRGNVENEEVVMCDPVSRTLLMGESLMRLSEGSSMRRLMGKVRGCDTQATVPLSYQFSTQELKLLRWSLQEILTWPFDHILPIHGDPIIADGKRQLATAYQWALKN
ncbi:DUF4336 domain-containing protein [Enterovibrio paralichthyis]|uniref:DUF4336 domain-containing protein n=1 Tax=Enterovibrio paralichthyis TaxID=2853805 RepID=UPI001C46DC1A|nr:DUF4336 domain-containing protein [Enterovibrio paralichthyis]MBV7296660.1 DUF4336 domain-containing protein [Enterovibrio paralichthyis]